MPEGRALGQELWDFALEALKGLPADAHAQRARLYGQLTSMGYYHDSASIREHSEQAQADATQANDPVADLAAIRARHMVQYAPEHAAERLELAARLGEAARSVRRPSVALWEPLWRIDALVELGRLPEAVATPPLLRRCVTAAGAPIARWHLARTEAALAQATGHFAEGLARAATARGLFEQLEGPFPAEGVYLGFRVALEMHAGWTEDLAERWKAIDLSLAPPFLGELPMPGVARTNGRDRRSGRRAGALSAAQSRGWLAATPVAVAPPARGAHQSRGRPRRGRRPSATHGGPRAVPGLSRRLRWRGRHLRGSGRALARDWCGRPRRVGCRRP